MAGGTVYFLFFDFIHHTLDIPHGMVKTQMIANFGYGIFGVLIFAAGRARIFIFQYLVAMNFVYAVACIFVAGYLLSSSPRLGAGLILAEGVFIFILAMIEKSSLQRRGIPQHTPRHGHQST